jgi:hypothetical protein
MTASQAGGASCFLTALDIFRCLNARAASFSSSDGRDREARALKDQS